MSKIGIICAMDDEVIAIKRKMHIEQIDEKMQMLFYRGLLEETEVVVVRCNVGKVSAAVCTQTLIDAYGVSYIISVGLAGGLSPDLLVGDIVLAGDTTQIEKLIPIQGELQKLWDTERVFIGHITSSDQFLESIELKGKHTTFTAYCAEMEGIAIAHACYLSDIPFIMMRSISDQADPALTINYDDFSHIASKNASEFVDQIICRIK